MRGVMRVLFAPFIFRICHSPPRRISKPRVWDEVLGSVCSKLITLAATIERGSLLKIYGAEPGGEKRYSPAKCNGARRRAITGSPEEKHISTSYAERQNLTMRMHMRRFTRLTNAFSKKIENHACAVALHSMYYNFVRIHQTLRVTRAMAAGVTDKLWEIADIVTVLEEFEAAQKIEPPTVFQIVKLDIGEGFFIRVIFPNQERDAIYGFETTSKAQDWIDRELRAWLAGHARPALSPR